jgi:hypothetical protein
MFWDFRCCHHIVTVLINVRGFKPGPICLSRLQSDSWYHGFFFARLKDRIRLSLRYDSSCSEWSRLLTGSVNIRLCFSRRSSPASRLTILPLRLDKHLLIYLFLLVVNLYLILKPLDSHLFLVLSPNIYAVPMKRTVTF